MNAGKIFVVLAVVLAAVLIVGFVYVQLQDRGLV